MNKQTITMAVMLLVLASCLESKRTVNKTDTTNAGTTYYKDTYQQNPDPYNPGTTTGGTGTNTGGEQTDDGDGYGDGNEDGVADGGQTQDYITLSGIVLHGTAGLNRYSRGTNYLWSSAVDLSPSDQGIFYTNSRFNVRVRVQAAPGQNTQDSIGNNCQYIANPYKKLSVDVCVRKQGGSCIYTQTFDEVTVGQVSKVKEFTVSTSSTPLIVEVLGVRWDYSCQNYLDQGYSINAPELNGVCPVGLVWDTSCVKFDIQFSTDYTKDFPATAPRY
jgi:hypothetical protein